MISFQIHPYKSEGKAMQYKASNVSEYMSQLEDDWRKDKLEVLRELIKKKSPDVIEGINYGMLSYNQGDDNIFHLNAQKNYVSLYVGDTKKIDPSNELLKGLNMGKGCIRIKKSTIIEDTNLDSFIELTFARWKEGVDIGC